VYLPEVEQIRKDTDFYIPSDKEHNIEPAISTIPTPGYGGLVLHLKRFYFLALIFSLHSLSSGVDLSCIPQH